MLKTVTNAHHNFRAKSEVFKCFHLTNDLFISHHEQQIKECACKKLERANGSRFCIKKFQKCPTSLPEMSDWSTVAEMQTLQQII